MEGIGHHEQRRARTTTQGHTSWTDPEIATVDDAIATAARREQDTQPGHTPA